MRGGSASVMIVLSIAVATLMLSGAGFADAWGGNPPQTSSAEEKLNESAGDMDPSEQPISGPVSSGETEVVGLIVSGLTSIVNFAGAVGNMESTLISLGFPGWFAGPVELLAYTLVGVAIIQFATNRVFE